MGINYFGKTDIGLKRETNQDCYRIQELSDGLVLMVVCDGMGGVAGGSEASNLAADTFCAYLEGHIKADNKNEYLKLFEAALYEANEAVCKKAKQDRALDGMGTTLVCALYDGSSYYCLWVGDSRIYAVTKSGLCQISHDHSFVQTLVDNGSITKEEAKRHPNRNIITKAVGAEAHLSCDVCKIDADNFDGILLCSDGLCGYVEEDDIFKICSEEKDAEGCCEKLIKKANDNGGADNITVVIHIKQ